jgi:hypothetical protein
VWAQSDEGRPNWCDQDNRICPDGSIVMRTGADCEFICPDADAPAETVSETATLVGIAFVDASVTSEGSRAVLPSGTKVLQMGSTVTGTEGCPTTPYQTDGLIVAVIDYRGRPTKASVTVTRYLGDGQPVRRAPYHLDLDGGRTLQFLGPIFDNGNYDLELSYFFGLGNEKKMTGSFKLARSCKPVS